MPIFGCANDEQFLRELMEEDFQEVKSVYRACIRNICSGTCYQSKEEFDDYEEAWSYLRKHIPDGFEGYVVSLPKLEINFGDVSCAK